MQTKKINDERAEGDLLALTVKASLVPETLDWRWEIFNERLEGEPPRFGLKDAKLIAPNRLGEYADRHLTWGRNSVLGRLGKGPNAAELLAGSVRQARTSFAAGDRTSFADVIQNWLPKHAGRRIRISGLFSGRISPWHR